MQRTLSEKLFAQAKEVLVGGVSSPVRAFKGVGGNAICLARGQGAHVWDVDNNCYIDFVGSYGPLILGHAQSDVIEAIAKAAKNGTTFGATVEAEVRLAETVCRAVPSMQKVRFVSSGTEATMSALRLARGYTKRAKVLKFAGCYHGHADAFLVDEAGSGLATLGLPGSAGVTKGATQDTLTVAYNDLQAASELLGRYPGEWAAIIVEPVACNMGLVLPAPGFLQGLRQLCDAHGALLIFDEVITGFRLAYGGAQAVYGVAPDLTTFGKILGGGLPVGAYGGRAEVMDMLAPLGPVYQAGTLSGNPLAMAAGLAVLQRLDDPRVYAALDKMTAALQRGITDVLSHYNRPALMQRMGSIFHLWCVAGAQTPPANYEDIKRADTAFFARLFHGLQEHGIALAPSSYEVGFIGAAHTLADVERTIDAFDHVLKSMANERV